uniref:USP domain-containing protein n=1 Tax=Oryza punctata TaxID=4537 RepID=A0A0E0M463_ORYPU
MGRGVSQAQQRKEAEAAARLNRRIEEVSNPRQEAREALLLDRSRRHDEAIARVDELAAKHPESAAVAHLAGILHYHATTRAIAARDRQGIEKHRDTARDFYIQAKRLAPNCIEIAVRLALARLRCFHDGEAEPEIERALAISFPTDPAENNVAYDAAQITSNSRDRVEKARKVALDRRLEIVSHVRNTAIPGDVRAVLDYAESDGVAKAVKPAKEVALRYPYTARAHLTYAYIRLKFAQGLAPGIDNRTFLGRILTDLDMVASQFKTSLVLAMFRAKLSFLLGKYVAMTAECIRANAMEGPADPWDDDVPPRSVLGEKPEDRVSSIRKELGRLQKKLDVVAIDYMQSLTIEERDSVLSAGLNSMIQHFGNEKFDEATKIMSDALSFVKKSGSWRYWICPYCVGKKIPNTDALLQHMRNKHPEGSVWPKLLSVLDPNLISDTSRGDHFLDDITVYEDSDEHYVFHFKRILPPAITDQRPFPEIRENKCTEGIEILGKIKLKLKNVPADILSTEFNEACSEIRDLWHYFLEISVLDFRVVLLPHVMVFIWERFLQSMSEKAASESVSAADIDVVFPYVDTPDIDEIFPNDDDALDNNAADNDAICPKVPDASDSNAANIDAIHPNVVDASSSNASNTDAVCHSTDDAHDINAAACPNVGDAPENNADDTDAVIPNIADVPDRNSDIKDGSNLSHANKVQEDEVNQKPENTVLSCLDGTSTDVIDKQSDVHVKDEDYGATVNENESNTPTEMVEYGNELDATPGKFDQSTEEIASISCYQKSIDVLKKNNADEDLYFLNVIIQLLWNLRHFRNEFLRGRSTFDMVHEDLCIAQKLYMIFSAWEKNEHSKMVLLLTDVKTTLCGIVNDSNMFQMVGRNFASEIMAIILQRLDKFENSVCVGSMRIVIDAPCRYCVWYTLGLFGTRLKQLMSCRCGEWLGEEYILLFHKLDASSPHSTKINCFDELPMLMDYQSDCERRCNNCSGSVKQIGCFLSKGPHFFTIVVKDWLGSDGIQAILSEALFGIGSPLDITLLYKGVTLPHIGGHSATKYRLASVICYTEQGYVCFARDQDKWLKYDTTTVKTVDTWGELLELYREINIQPEVLVYEVIK